MGEMEPDRVEGVRLDGAIRVGRDVPVAKYPEGGLVPRLRGWFRGVVGLSIKVGESLPDEGDHIDAGGDFDPLLLNAADKAAHGGDRVARFLLGNLADCEGVLLAVEPEDDPKTAVSQLESGHVAPLSG